MKKILIIIPFLSMFLFLTSSFSVKANNVTFPAFPLPVEGKSSTHYLILRDNDTNNYFLFKPLDPTKVEITKYELDYQIYFDTSAIIYTWSEGERSWQTYREITTWGKFNFNRFKYGNGTIEFLYSSFALYWTEDYNNGDLFFQRAPIKATFLDHVRELEMGAVLKTVVKVIPMVMIAAAGFLGFRKALRLLLKVLHQA